MTIKFLYLPCLKKVCSFFLRSRHVLFNGEVTHIDYRHCPVDRSRFIQQIQEVHYACVCAQDVLSRVATISGEVQISFVTYMQTETPY